MNAKGDRRCRDAAYRMRYGERMTFGGKGLGRSILGLAALLAVLLQFGCSTADVLGSHLLDKWLEDDPTVVEATVTAAADVNPDVRNRPSPIKVRFYLLKSPKVLQNSNYYDLKEQSRELLADDLRLYDERVFKPGAVSPVKLVLPPEETLEDERLFFAVVAGYWSVDQAIWQVVKEIEVHETTVLEIALESTGVSLVVKD